MAKPQATHWLNPLTHIRARNSPNYLRFPVNKSCFWSVLIFPHTQPPSTESCILLLYGSLLSNGRYWKRNFRSGMRTQLPDKLHSLVTNNRKGSQPMPPHIARRESYFSINSESTIGTHSNGFSHCKDPKAWEWKNKYNLILPSIPMHILCSPMHVPNACSLEGGKKTFSATSR